MTVILACHCEEPRKGDAWISLFFILKSSAVLTFRFINEGKYAAIPFYKSEIASPSARNDAKKVNT